MRIDAYAHPWRIILALGLMAVLWALGVPRGMVILLASVMILAAAVQARVTISLSASSMLVSDGSFQAAQAVDLAAISQVVLRPFYWEGVNVVLVAKDRELHFGGLLSENQKLFLARLLLARARLARGE